MLALCVGRPDANNGYNEMLRRLVLIPACLTLTAMLAACSDSSEDKAASAPAGMPAREVTVGVITLKQQVLPFTTILPGRADALQTASIRPQVSGVITAINFKEGTAVKKGDLLYQIEDKTYAAALEQAQASVAKAEASVPSAEANLARYERLVNSGATQIEYESAKVTLLQAKADVASAEAAVRTAEINLDYTKVRAPFDGTTGPTLINIGNVVTANQTDALVTLRQIDPIYIDLTESSTNLLKLRDMISSGRLQGAEQDAVIRLTLEDGTQYDKPGTLDMSELAVSETTGTFAIRALFQNPDQRVLPGMYVRATVEIGREKGFLIPQRAATRDARGDLNAKFVGPDNTVETRSFSDVRTSNGDWLVTEDIKDGDKLIVDGFQALGMATKVKPVDVTIDENGLVVTPPTAAPAAQTN